MRRIAIRGDYHLIVDAFHEANLNAGGRDNGPPGIRARYHDRYYAAYVLDPDGISVEVVCHTSMMVRMKELEAENAPEEDVRRGALEGRYPQGGDVKKVLRPSRRREMAKEAVESKGISIRLACDIFQVSQTCYRYKPKRNAENEEIADWVMRLTDNHRYSPSLAHPPR